MTETLIQAAQFFLSLSILIVLHELGHFIPAKLFKTRVEKFYLFFDPYFSLIKKKIGDTEYGIGWLPLGGYVKISGMIDESMDKEQLKEEPKPWEFRSKPAWQRLIIMLGGVTVNVLLAMFIYAMMLFTWGSSYLKTENAIYGIQCSEFAKEIGFQNGDKIITVDGVYYENFNELPEAILLSGKTTEVLLDRNGEQVRVEIPSNIIEQFIENNSSSGFINFAYPSVVEKFVEGSVAESVGLKPGDQLIGLNGEEVLYVSDYINALSSFINQEITLSVQRGLDTLHFDMVLGNSGKMGVYFVSPTELVPYDRKQYRFFESFPAGSAMAIDKLDSYVQQMKLMLNPETGAWKGLGGFISIGKNYSPNWDWFSFWNFTAFLSIILAVMNILPIPALDGGHVLILLIEMVMRRDINPKILGYIQMVGMVLLLGLFILANVNDVIRLFQ